jgi:hypothetical protein
MEPTDTRLSTLELLLTGKSEYLMRFGNRGEGVAGCMGTKVEYFAVS